MIALSQCPGIDQTGKDSSAALQAAFNQRQPITWDCPVSCLMGTDPTKSIFVPDGSDVTFTPKGLLTITNAGFPGLCFYHSSGHWRGTRIRYAGSLSTMLSRAASVWTDITAKQYLEAAKLNTFASGYNTFWSGPTNSSAIFSVRGASGLIFEGLEMFVDPDAPACAFIPVALGIDYGYTPHTLVQADRVLVAPSVTVSDMSLDGVIMGVVGGGAQVSFTRCTRKRYADLQDAQGTNFGGIGTWFAPPHWFYLQGSPTYPLTVKLVDCMDLAEFAGAGVLTPRYLHPLKVELANGSSVEGFHSRCRYGGLAVLSNGSTTGGTVRNCSFRVDTSSLDILGKPAGAPGLFFPSSHPYPASDIQMAIVNAVGTWPVQNVPASVTTHLSVYTGPL